ncbi:hypothetical protein DQ04_25351000, partial [Trypanosoma grayi]|uniref:hypothetical protein n=1 Tax=Trypanosoma grayi TaxID=71804 RepID=UPI0004F4B26D
MGLLGAVPLPLLQPTSFVHQSATENSLALAQRVPKRRAHRFSSHLEGDALLMSVVNHSFANDYPLELSLQALFPFFLLEGTSKSLGQSSLALVLQYMLRALDLPLGGYSTSVQPPLLDSLSLIDLLSVALQPEDQERTLLTLLMRDGVAVVHIYCPPE